MSASLIPTPVMQFFDSNGDPLSGGKVYTYAAGTSTPLATYTDQGGATPNANPVILDSRGEAAIWFGVSSTSSYKIVLKTSADVLIWTADNVTASLASLAASSGSSLIGFLQAGSGAVARTVQAKERDTVSVKDFGAVGNGTTNDTTAIQAAITAGANIVYFPPGTYVVSSALTMTSGVALVGAGNLASQIKYTGSGICVDMYGCSQSFVKDIGLLTDMAGTTQAIRIYGSENGIQDVRIAPFTANGANGWSIGITVEGKSDLSVASSETRINNVSLWFVRATAIRVTRAIDTFLNGISSFGTPNSITVQHLVVETGTSGLYADQCSFGYGKNGVVIQTTLSAGTGTYGYSPIYLFFNQVLADTMSGGHGWEFGSSLSTSTVSASLTACWSAASGLDNTGAVITSGSNGILLSGGQGISITSGTRIRRNSRNGIVFNSANVAAVTIDASYITANNIENNAGAHGVYVATASPYVTITNNTIGNLLDSGTGKQKYGVAVDAVAATGLIVTSNDLSSNDTGPISNSSTGQSTVFGNAPNDTTQSYQLYTGIRMSDKGRWFAERKTITAAGTSNLAYGLAGGIIACYNASSGGSALYRVNEAGTSVLISGDTNFVVGAPGASQIGLSAVGATTTFTNGYGATQVLDINYLSAFTY